MIKGDDCITQIIEYVCVYDCMFFCLILPFEVALHFHFEILTCLYPNKVYKTRRDPKLTNTCSNGITVNVME